MMKLDDLKKLHQKKYRSQYGHFIVEGEHLLLELQEAAKVNPELSTSTVYVTEDKLTWAKEKLTSFPAKPLSNKQMAQISDTKSPQGILAVVPLPKASDESLTTSSTQPERAVYLHEVQDPGNLGTILRSLAWFGGFRLLLSKGSVDPFNSKVVRSSMGAIFHVPLELDVTLESLHNRFERFAYLDMQGSNIQSSAFADYPCYLFGNEARGVPSSALQRFNAHPFTISGSGVIDSLNLASAVNICAYQLSATQQA